VPTIVLVDDDPDLTEILTVVLEAEGYRVVVATNGEAGLRLAHEEHPDLILADVMMPVLGGMEMAKKVHGDSHLKDVPVILMSAGLALGQAIGETYQGFLLAR
jgi:DNA-binding response OmpR family regulator